MNTGKKNSLITKHCIVIVVALVLNSCVSYKRIIDTPVFIGGGANGKATANCTKEFEAVPSSVINPQGEIGWFAGFDFDRMNYAKGNWANWCR